VIGLAINRLAADLTESGRILLLAPISLLVSEEATT
jgi:hypothetical protein